MKYYDIIIVGAGPAGLKCAEELSGSDKQVLLIDMEEHPGDKLCAGGLTVKGIRVLPLPDHVIENKITKAAIHSRRQTAGTSTSKPFLFTVDRKELGAYQLSLLENTPVDVLTGNQVTAIKSDRIIIKDGAEFKYNHLIGADGYASVVRKYLNLPVNKKLIGFQYKLPANGRDPVLEIFLDQHRFRSHYAWIFPHRESISVGCCCDPGIADHKKIVTNFHNWLEEKNIDPGNAKLESYPISYDYRGLKFGNVFLIGEAAGLASGLTGEGIYQSLVSGQEVARMIVDSQYVPEPMKAILKYNRILHRIMLLVKWSGPFRGLLYELFLFLMNRKRFRRWINALFT